MSIEEKISNAINQYDRTNAMLPATRILLEEDNKKIAELIIPIITQHNVKEYRERLIAKVNKIQHIGKSYYIRHDVIEQIINEVMK